MVVKYPKGGAVKYAGGRSELVVVKYAGDGAVLVVVKYAGGGVVVVVKFECGDDSINPSKLFKRSFIDESRFLIPERTKCNYHQQTNVRRFTFYFFIYM